MKEYRLFSIIAIFLTIFFISLWKIQLTPQQVGVKLNSDNIFEVKPAIVHQTSIGKVTLLEFFAGH